MCPLEKRRKLTDLSNRYRYAFILIGTPDTSYNKMRFATFLSTKKPREYEIFLEDNHKTVVFWNPYENENQSKQS